MGICTPFSVEGHKFNPFETNRQIDAFKQWNMHMVVFLEQQKGTSRTAVHSI